MSKIIKRATQIKKNLGVRSAAGYCRNKGISLEAALWILLQVEVR